MIQKKIPNLDAARHEASLTPMEAMLLPYWELLSTAALLATHSPTQLTAVNVSGISLPTISDRILAGLDSLPIAYATTPTPGPVPMAASLQNHFLLFDLLKATHLFADRASTSATKPSVPRKTLEGIRRRVLDLFTQLQAHAKRERVKATSCAGDVVKVMLREGVFDVMMEKGTFGEELSAWSGRIEQSAVDAWDGVLRVKMGKGKGK